MIHLLICLQVWKVPFFSIVTHTTYFLLLFKIYIIKDMIKCIFSKKWCGGIAKFNTNLLQLQTDKYFIKKTLFIFFVMQSLYYHLVQSNLLN